MTSKIVVNNIESDSGISSVTFTSDIELGTKNLKGHNLESTGIVTAVSFTGSGANLTNLPAGNLSGTLPAIDGSNLTGVGASFGNSSVNTSGIITATAFVPTTQGSLSHRNLIINGDMRIAQRGTSSTTSGYGTVDRFKCEYSGTDEATTQAQVDVASGTTPYTLGFRKAYKVTNGNQTGGAGSSDRITILHLLEAQDMANSGWNYLSSSSYITFSYWVKSSVAQNFYVRFKSADTTSQAYVIETGSLSANTWTKITKTIPGNSNIVFNNDTGEGLEITWELFRGTDQTGTRPLNAWAAADNATRTPDQTSTWYTTNDATFEITGVQLEVGPVATPFEHRSYGDELRRCQRYYQQYVNLMAVGFVPDNSSKSYSHGFVFPVPFRGTPTTTLTNTGSSSGQYCGDGDTNRNISSLNASGNTFDKAELYFNLTGDLSNFRGAYLFSNSSTAQQTTYYFTAEL